MSFCIEAKLKKRRQLLLEQIYRYQQTKIRSQFNLTLLMIPCNIVTGFASATFIVTAYLLSKMPEFY